MEIPTPSTELNSSLIDIEKNIENNEEKINVPFRRFFEIDYDKCIDGKDNTNIMRKLKYRQREGGEVKLAMHFGQRKLLLTEIEFLTNCGNLSDTVVYVGSAPGYHIKLLTKYFPNHKFELYDPSKFGIDQTNNVKIHQLLFTDAIAQNYVGKGILFISDIRTDMHKYTEEWEEEIIDNMNTQKKWVEIINPKMAMLKFRLPYNPGITKYFSGKIYFQPWVGQSSTETRLITNGKEYTLYDNTDYEQILYRHNRITRNQKFDHQYTKIEGLDYCYDCKAEIEILIRYINLCKLKKMIKSEDKNEMILKKIIYEISETLHIDLTEPPHYIFKDLPRKEREEKLKKYALEYTNKEKNKKNEKPEKCTDDFIS
jgi:cap2 methyltransferase